MTVLPIRASHVKATAVQQGLSASSMSQPPGYAPVPETQGTQRPGRSVLGERRLIQVSTALLADTSKKYKAFRISCCSGHINPPKHAVFSAKRSRLQQTSQCCRSWRFCTGAVRLETFSYFCWPLACLLKSHRVQSCCCRSTRTKIYNSLATPRSRVGIKVLLASPLHKSRDH